MKQLVTAILRQCLFLVILFAASRLLMFILNANILLSNGINISQVLQSFIYALPLDIATACYIIAVPIMLLIAQSIFPTNIISVINKSYIAIIIAIYSFLTIGEIGLYPEWETKMGYKALLYFKRPSEVIHTMSLFQIIAATTLIIGFVILLFWIFRRWFFKPMTARYKYSYILSPMILITLTPILVIGARGGIDPIPINQSQVYFSNHAFVNATTVNNLFNIVVSISENKNIDRNSFAFYDNEKAEETVFKLYTPTRDTSTSITAASNPNIVLILLESWGADLIESLGGDSRITPNFHQLEQEGILFTNIYSNGKRSEQGMSSTFGGFPSIPFTHIVSQPEKSSQLPSFIKTLNNLNYNTTFNFGGELRYGNIKGYIVGNGFDRVLENKDFDSEIPRGRLGIHDQYLYSEVYKQLNNTPQPFFTTIYTLSSHNPYDQPKVVSIPDWKNEENPYIQSSHYADYAIGEFIKEAKTQPWYDNTIFILIADHSHKSYKPHEWQSPNSHRIPLLIFGNPIVNELKGTQNPIIGTNSDIPATILSILGQPHDQFPYSKNLLNPTSKQFAYYSIDEGGYGWVTSEGSTVWRLPSNSYHFVTIPENKQDSIDRDARSFLQTIFKQYLDY